MSLSAKLSKNLSLLATILLLIFSLSFSTPKISHAGNFITDSIAAASETALQGWLRSFVQQLPVEMLSWCVGDTAVAQFGLAYENIATKNYYALSQPQQFNIGGILGFTTNTVAVLYNPPASGVQYLAQLKNNFLGGKPVYAQNGIGFKGLQPILPIWQSFRNFVYVLFSLLFIIVGIMIILRVKISSQAVISLQTALPNIITTLLLVTFSYAIAGLLIDLIYVIQGAVILIIDPSFLGPVKNFFGSIPFLQNWLPGIATMTNPNILSTFSMLTLPAVAASLAVGVMAAVITFPISLLLAIPTFGASLLSAPVAGGLVAIIAFLVFTIIVIFNIIKFLLGLFKVYVTLIFSIILAPLQIAMGAFPNSKLNFSSWIMDFVANLAVFPISFLFLFLVNTIIWKIMGAGASSTATDIINMLKGQGNGLGMWVPGMIGGNLPGSGIVTGNITVGAIGLSAIMLLPKLPEMIPQFIFNIKPSPWGTAIGEGFAATDPRKTQAYKLAKTSAGMEIENPQTAIGTWINTKLTHINPDAPKTVNKIISS